jgi:hypothetical protein
MDVFGLTAGEQGGYLRDAVLLAAHELDLASALPASAESAAAKLGLKSARRLRRLLDALALFGLARREGGLFHAAFHAAAGDRKLPRGGWGSLAQVIRADAPLDEPGVRGAGDEEGLRRFHSHLLGAGEAPARELWERLSASGPLLDLGGGTGTYTSAFLAAHPGEGATLADTPAVLRLAAVSGARLLPLDLLNGAYPASQGTALLANVLHLFGPEHCRSIVAKAAQALRPGGLLVVKDLLIEPDRSGPAESVLFALNMALFTAQGDVHEPALLEAWLRGAGLGTPRRLALRSSPGSVVLAAQSLDLPGPRP